MCVMEKETGRKRESVRTTMAMALGIVVGASDFSSGEKWLGLPPLPIRGRHYESIATLEKEAVTRVVH